MIFAALLSCSLPVIAMKTAGDPLEGRPAKRQKTLHELFDEDDIYKFYIRVAFDDADVNEVDENGYPLIWNILSIPMPQWRKNRYIEILAENGVNLSAINPSGITLLHRAADERDPDTVEQLLKLGANPMVEDVKGWTPLHYVLFDENKENEDSQRVIGLLCNAGADPNAQTVDGKTTLFFTRGNKEHVKSLLARGADHRREDGKRRKPYDYLEQKNCPSKILKDHNSVRNVIMPEVIRAVGTPTNYVFNQKAGGPRLTFDKISK